MTTYCIPTYKSFDLCVKAVEAVLASKLQPDRIIVCDTSGKNEAHPHVAQLIEDGHMDLLIATNRMGVATAWNKLIELSEPDEYIIIANDDVTPHPDAISALIKAANSAPNDFFFAGKHGGANAFSFFLIKRSGYNEVGPFDERFFPAYFEDNDYTERILRAGKRIVIVPEADYDHAGSSTIKRYSRAEMDEHHEQFRNNRRYFTYKWGGEPGNTRYEKPFNGRNE